MFSDSMIKDQIERGRIRITGGLDNESGDTVIQPASYELTLGADLLLAHPSTREHWIPIELPDGLYWPLQPGIFALGTTAETITLDSQVAARLEGKSTLARKGLVVHSTAGFIDPGFSGQITLELSNVSPWPIILEQGMRIAQLTFEAVIGKVERPYGTESLGSHYQGQRGATLARS